MARVRVHVSGVCLVVHEGDGVGRVRVLAPDCTSDPLPNAWDGYSRLHKHECFAMVRSQSAGAAGPGLGNTKVTGRHLSFHSDDGQVTLPAGNHDFSRGVDFDAIATSGGGKVDVDSSFLEGLRGPTLDLQEYQRRLGIFLDLPKALITTTHKPRARPWVFPGAAAGANVAQRVAVWTTLDLGVWPSLRIASKSIRSEAANTSESIPVENLYDSGLLKSSGDTVDVYLANYSNLIDIDIERIGPQRDDDQFRWLYYLLGKESLDEIKHDLDSSDGSRQLNFPKVSADGGAAAAAAGRIAPAPEVGIFDAGPNGENCIPAHKRV